MFFKDFGRACLTIGQSIGKFRLEEANNFPRLERRIKKSSFLC